MSDPVLLSSWVTVSHARRTGVAGPGPDRVLPNLVPCVGVLVHGLVFVPLPSREAVGRLDDDKPRGHPLVYLLSVD